ncbi:MAG: hypothetical protein AABZ14_05645 [Candidatus Margulisiibacteriota bacterium]
MMVLERQIRDLLVDINQPDLLDQMMADKKRMMEDIRTVEEELSPLRKEIATFSSTGKLADIDQEKIAQLKNADLMIIDLISKISRIEQELSERVSEQMEVIRTRLQQAGQQRSLENKYSKVVSPLRTFEALKVETAEPSRLDTTG